MSRRKKADIQSETAVQRDADVKWEGDSKQVISKFPPDVKQDLGYQLRLLQQGKEPTDYRPMSSIGAGVFELREQDERAWYRVIYLSRIDDVIYVLHCLEKQSKKLPKPDRELAQQRLKMLKARLREQKKNAKRI